MTQSYYWFVEVSPESENVVGEPTSYLKRSTSLPRDGYFYIREDVDGYRHTITPKGSRTSTYRSDYGKINDLSTILRDISDQIVSKWRESHMEFMRKKRLEEAKKYKSKSEVKELEEDEEREKLQSMMYGGMGYGGIYARKKSSLKRRKVHLNRKGPCKCMKTTRRERKK